MCNDNELEKLITTLQSQKEGCHLEFKEATNNLPKSLWETYSSFANTSGGYIFLGVKDDPIEIIGVNNPDKLVKDLFNIAGNKEKVNYNILENQNVTTHEISNKKIISIYIPELAIAKKPLYLDNNIGKAYIRKNEGDFRATEDELRRFIRNSHSNIDGELLENYTLEDLDYESILEFKNILHNRNSSKKYLEMDNLEFLIEMGVFQIDRDDNRKPKLTLAGLLFLGKLDAITQKLPYFHLEYFNKRGKNSNRWKDRVSTGDLSYPNLNLFQYYKVVLEKLKVTIEDPFELDEKCIRKSPIELEIALREALANMIIHADYLDSETTITITVENFFYTFLNPGTMKISTSQFFTGGKSNPRNNTLISYFRRMGICERAGSGGKEIFNVVEKNKFRDPELITTQKSTFLKLWTATLENSYPEFPENTRKVLLYMREKKIAKFDDIKSDLSLSIYNVRKAIDELLQKDILRVDGKGRASRYMWNPSKLEWVATADWYCTFISNKI
jgi:ATP-dependent DNA helicase RecG